MNRFKLTNLVLPLVVILSTFIFSCAKKATGVRTVRQTEANIVNPSVSNPSVEQANNQNLLYTLSVVELPGEAADGTFTVKAEIRTPSNKFIPITTTHTNGQDVNGVYTDADTGTQLDIRARCLGSACNIYILLVTVIKNNYSVHQVVATSYLTNETAFNIEHINATVAPTLFYRSLDEVVQRNKLQ